MADLGVKIQVDVAGLSYAMLMKAKTTVRALLVSRVHLAFTQAADDLYALGKFNQEQRIGFSNAIGDALGALNAAIDADPKLKVAADATVTDAECETVMDKAFIVKDKPFSDAQRKALADLVIDNIPFVEAVDEAARLWDEKDWKRVLDHDAFRAVCVEKALEQNDDALVAEARKYAGAKKVAEALG